MTDWDFHVELHMGTCCPAIRNSMNDCGDGPVLSCEARGPGMAARHQQNTNEWQSINRTQMIGKEAYWIAVTGRQKRLVNLMYQPAMLLS